jgi:hypothetical protein
MYIHNGSGRYCLCVRYLDNADKILFELQDSVPLRMTYHIEIEQNEGITAFVIPVSW